MVEVSKKENGFNKAMVRNVLAANPQAAKSAPVQDNLDNRVNQLPQYMRDQINLGLTKLSPKEYLEWVRAVEKRKYDRLLNRVLKTWISDRRKDHSNEIIDLLSNTHPGGQAGDINNDYRLVEYYDKIGKRGEANAVLNAVNAKPLSSTQQADFNHYSDFRNLTHQWKQNGVDMTLLDTAQIEILREYASYRYPIGARAMALLNLNHELYYTEPILLPVSGDKSNRSGTKSAISESADQLVLFPNPTDNYFTVDYNLRDMFNAGLLVIFDSSGKKIYQVDLSYAQDQLLVETGNWPGGQYSCILLADGKTMLSEKITIIK